MAQHHVLRYALVLMWMTTLTAFAEDPFRFKHLTLRDGLSNNSVYQMAQDSFGFMWLGTFSGLNRYDGTRVDIFRPEPMDPDSISGSVIFDIVEDNSGRVWIGTDGGGLNRYDVAADAFRSYLPDDTRPRSISSAKAFSVEVGRSGRIWVGTGDAGISVLDPKDEQFTNYRAAETPGLESDVIRVIVRDVDGDMWVGTQGGGLSLSHRAPSFRSFLPETTVRDVFISAGGTVWVGLEREGLLRLEGDKSDPEFITVLEDMSVRTINEDSAGRLWIGTERSGVAVVEPDGGVRWITSDPDDDASLSSDFIRDIFVDASNLVWVATRGGGVNIYNPRSTGFSRIIPGKEYSTLQMLEVADGTLWIATDGQGIYQLSPDGEVTNLRSVPDTGLSSDHLYALVEDVDGIIWAGSDGSGLDLINTATGDVTNYRHDPRDSTSLSSDVIWSLLITSEGDLWAGSEGGGLNRYDRIHDRFERFQNDPDRPDSLLGSSIRALYEDSSGTLWVGAWDGGLSYKLPGENRFVNFTRDPNDPHSISDNSVNCITGTDDGMVWIGTSGGGLNSFDPQTRRFESFRVEDGLADNHVLGIVRDETGFLWITTANGLSRFDLITRQFTNYWDSDGLPANGFSRNAYLEMNDGTILVGSGRGAVRFQPDELRPNPYAPPVRITGFSLFNEPITQASESAGWPYLKESIIVSEDINVYPGDTFIGFSFAALDFTDPSRNKYAVQLIGFDQQIHYLDTGHRHYYSSLPPGSYTLRVMGTNSNGAWSTRSAEIGVIVHPAFHQTWYFYAFVLAAIAAVATTVVRVRFSRLIRHNVLLREFSRNVQEAREEERTLVARDVHDELGQLLTTLKLHIYWLSRNASSEEDQRQARYDSMLGIIGATLDWTKDMASRLRPAIIDNLSVSEAIEWLIRETEKHTDLEIRRRIAPGSALSTDRATGLFRLVQEILTNIVRHSGATTAEVHISTADDRMRITVSDNGTGIDKKALSDPRSYGIIGMKERVRYLGGEISFRTSGVGTTVHVEVPTGESKNS